MWYGELWVPVSPKVGTKCDCGPFAESETGQWSLLVTKPDTAVLTSLSTDALPVPGPPPQDTGLGVAARVLINQQCCEFTEAEGFSELKEKKTIIEF